MLTIPDDDPRSVAAISAIRSGHVERLQRLLGENPGLASARIVDSSGVSRTLLHVASDWPGHFPDGARTVAVLIAAGSDVDAPVIHSSPGRAPETALHWAASSNDVSVLDALIDGGADIEAPGAVFTGGTPMSDAVVFGQWRAARRLVERGAQTTIWQAAALGLLDRVKEFCMRRPPPPIDQITNALWNACRGGHTETARFLFDQGADLNWIGHDQKTPLQVAEESGVEELIVWLRNNGARSIKELG